jgi:hypothetical protein
VNLVVLPPTCDSPIERTEARRLTAFSHLQLVIGDDRAEVSLHDLECLEDRPLFQELAVVLCALPVVAATDILGRKMSAAIPAPAASCCRIGVDHRCQLVMTAVTDVAKAIEMAILRLDESKPGVPERVSPVESLERVAGRPHERYLIRSPPASENARRPPHNREQAKNWV